MRVALERGEQVGSGSVGYKIRNTSVLHQAHCRLLFCTTGVLLQRMRYLGKGQFFPPETVTHLIVDEVHERSAEIDFLLTALREELPHRPDLRVVLMSATMDTK